MAAVWEGANGVGRGAEGAAAPADPSAAKEPTWLLGSRRGLFSGVGVPSNGPSSLRGSKRPRQPPGRGQAGRWQAAVSGRQAARSKSRFIVKRESSIVSSLCRFTIKRDSDLEKKNDLVSRQSVAQLPELASTSCPVAVVSRGDKGLMGR